MLYKVNAAGIIDPIREMHYRFHHKIDPSIFPQVHDFYEITLVTEGTMEMEINGVSQNAAAGTLMLLRPGDIHSRKAAGGCSSCSYINLAFPVRVLTEMFGYLEVPDLQQRMETLASPPKTVLSSGEAVLLKAQLEKLNLLPVDRPHVAGMELRRLMLDLMLQHFVPLFFETPEMNCPHWLNELLEKLEEPELFGADLEELAKTCGCTREHLCRSFRKYLGVSPAAYLNAKRLNYAANLLLHSDQKVIDIAYASGFQSLSRFYHAFKQEFGMSALEYRKAKLNDIL